jgi:hypothetical protein
MAIADHIADLADVVDLVGDFKDDWDSAYASILSSQLAAPSADTQGELAALAKNVTGGLRRHFAGLAFSLREGAEAVIRDMARTLNRSDILPSDPIPRILGVGLREWMVANAKKLKSRGASHGAASAVTGTGSGALITHTADDQSSAEQLEASTADTLTFKCVEDQSMGRASGEELFVVNADVQARDILELGGANSRRIGSIHSGNITAIANADFSASFGSDATATTKIPSFTITGTPANLTQDTTNTFRGKPSLSLVTSDNTIYQAFSGLPNDRPSIASILYNRQIGSGAGDLYVRLGSKEATVAVAAQTGWNRLYVIGWPKRYTGSGNDFEVFWDRTSGTINLAQAVVAPLERIGGRYHKILAGATDFLIDDYFTQATTVSPTDRSIKDWLHRWFGLGFELPHNGTASAGWEDPT